MQITAVNETRASAVDTAEAKTAPWTVAAIESLYALPFNDLLYRAQTVHRQHFDANSVQLSTLLSIKTGGCAEDCGYCPQAARYHTDVPNEALMSVEEVVAAARCAREKGATRFCMGAAWRSPKQRDLDRVIEMVKAVRGLGMETCATLGMLKAGQAGQLKSAGLDYYNHNIDTAPEFYGEVIHTREYQDRLDTLAHVRDTGMKTCCGGIVGMGETRADRIGLQAPGRPGQQDQGVTRTDPFHRSAFGERQQLGRATLGKAVERAPDTSSEGRFEVGHRPTQRHGLPVGQVRQ